MDPQRWQRMWELFHRVEELDPAEREAFLEKECAGDAGMLAELRSLLVQADRPTTVLDRPAAGKPADEARPGEQVGAYRIVRRIAEGGMGVVYEAEQDEPVRRRVALKLIRPGLGTREVLARFRSERQALALLDHPSIARVFEAGETPDGRPFFAMELVDGESILAYADSRRLDTDARLALFAQVCDAVQHAHRRGVIHRDLKPSNILVSTTGDKPLAKVIDFGVARATGGESLRETQFTMAGQILGTPEYMSPEQAAGTGEDVDTRTDVYALGVILYELLAGAKPFEWGELRRAGYEAMWKVIREQDPPRPSRRLDTLGERATTIAKSRRTDPPSLVRRLNGDLDWVVMRCLEKERERRYDTPGDLARDLERHRNHHPIEARPPSAGYRMRKFVRRHRIGVASAAVVVLAILIGFVVGTVGYVRAVTAERESARSAEVANEVTVFLYSLFNAAAPAARDAGTADLGDVVKLGIERVERIEDAIVRGRVQRWLGSISMKLGNYEDARALLEASVATLVDGKTREAIGDLALSYNDLGGLELEAGRPQQARELFGRGLSVTDGDPGAFLTSRNTIKLNLIKALNTLGLHDTAREYQLQVIEGYEQGGDRRRLARAYRALATIEESLGNFEASRDSAMRSLALFEEFLEPDAPDIQYALNNLAVAEWRLENFEASGVLLERIIESTTRTHGADHPYTAAFINNLGRLKLDMRQWDEAERLLQDARAIRAAKLGRDHPNYANSLQNLATLRRRTGRPAEALPMQREAIAILGRAWGETNEQLAGPLRYMAETLDELGQTDEAEKVRARQGTLAAATE